ncbi:ULP_PROTEASE domain-containing protein, partial [Haematococcus lacustris]
MRYPDSSDGRAVVTVVGGDLAWLEEEAFLNDTIIDFFIRRIQENLPSTASNRYYFFNSFFYKKLSEKATAAAKAKAKAARKEQQQLEAALEASRLDAGMVDNTSAAARRPGGVAGQGTAGADLGQQSSSELELEYEEEGGPGTGQGQEEGQGMQQQQQGGEARTGKAAMVASGPGPSRGVSTKKPAPVLHGAAAHARVKKWTKNVDLFSKDYVFVPIHEALHWSLALICHPGRWAQQPGQPGTCILHLDSMASGRLHTPNTIFQTLRNYLAAEWASNAADPRPSTARAWAEAHPDAAPPSFNKEQCPCACCKGLPQQDNHCDCGLFLLSYIDFFCHADPAYIDHNLLPCTAAAMKKRGGGDTASLVPNQPAFMTVNWFTADNVNGLRQYLRYLIFQ